MGVCGRGVERAIRGIVMSISWVESSAGASRFAERIFPNAWVMSIVTGN